MFSSNRGGSDYEIFVIRPDGTGLRQLTDNNVDDRAPEWSPDGRSIAFQRTFVVPKLGTHMPQIWAMSRRGHNKRRLSPTRRSAADWHYESPRWSPDGSLIAFNRGHPSGGDYMIFVIEPDGSRYRKIADDPEGGVDLYDPAWLDQAHISFNLDGYLVIGRWPVSDAYGDRTEWIEWRDRVDMYGSHNWSADANRVLTAAWLKHCANPDFEDRCEGVYGGAINIIVYDRARNELTALAPTQGRTRSEDPDWSVDEQHIVFSSNRDGRRRYDFDIFIMDSDGSNVLRVTRGRAWDQDPDWWSPT